jgi:hypothetical protein
MFARRPSSGDPRAEALIFDESGSSSANEHKAAAMMENQRDHDRSNVHHIKRAKPLVSRTRLVMILLLIVAIPEPCQQGGA